MTFNKFIALIAIAGMAIQANATSDGTLRRNQTMEVAQNDVEPSQSQPQVIVIPASSRAQTTTIQTASAQQQPTTVVEAAPVSESKAEAMRRARQNAEVNTEQKIVEKLEESRLKEEQQRADRLFGDRLETPAPAPVVAPAPVAPAPAPAPVVSEAPEAKPTQQVTIEHLEIVQPQPEKVEKPEAPVAESKMEVEAPKEDAFVRKFYLGALVAAPSYAANNVKTNYGLGVTVGTLLDEHNAIELGFMYSSYLIDTYWKYGLYNEMTQYDLQAAYKYYFMTDRIKPYAGASVTYISRSYEDRVKKGLYYGPNKSESEQTNAVDMGLTAGADFVVNPAITIGAGLDYNHNVMNSRNNFTQAYNLQPEDSKPLEEIDYYTFKVNAKLSF